MHPFYTILLSFFLLLPWSARAQDKPKLHVGGALRFNYNLSDWKDEQMKRGGDFGYDLFRINAKADYKNITLNAEYRLYAQDFGGGMLKQGWLGYALSEQDELQLGLTQVPFGIGTYNSNSFFFSMAYYAGLEDDYDMGLKYSHAGERWEYDLAFFKNAEELRFGNVSDLSNSRYAYDAGTFTDGEGKKHYRNKEVNQLNARVIYKLAEDEAKHKLGASGSFGGLYNLDTEDMGTRYALALHYQLTYRRWDLKAQLASYEFRAANPETEPSDQVALTAFGAPYLIASEARIYTLALAYNIPVQWGPISSVKLYNDFGWMDKTKKSFEDSYMNVAGAMVTAGNLYTYIDCAMGKNQPWLGSVWTTALSNGSPEAAKAEWSVRYNINFGYYF
ncbi:MAG: hypothetical protein MI784_16160 [Cytophagales bacterium]|nr:hypothetical protein [Cytophagales bacterium]